MSRSYHSLLLDLMNAEFNGNSFNGPNLVKTINAIPFTDLSDTDTYENYSVVGIVLHIIFWKIAFTKGIGGASTVTLPYDGENWPDPPQDLTPEVWKSILDILDVSHREQIEAIQALDPAQLESEMAWECSNGEAVAWIATHDTYHIAQIRNMGLHCLQA